MPELPEVETITRELCKSDLIGAAIVHADVFWPKVIDELTTEAFSERLSKQKILSIQRRGKYILFKLTHDTLFVHLRMTGKILITSGKSVPIHKHEHLRIHLSNKKVIHFEDQRKFGRWVLTSTPEIKLGLLGLEPFSEEFTVDRLEELLSGHAMQIKPFLLNQHFIAGLGNIYVDEALWKAKIHPQTLTSEISRKQTATLHLAIREVLQSGIDNEGTSLGTYRSNYFSTQGRRGGNQLQLNVFRREGLPCPRCGTLMIKIKVAQRGTHLCPKCQL